MPRLKPTVPGADRRVRTVSEAVRLAEHLWCNGAWQEYTERQVVHEVGIKLRAMDASTQLPDWSKAKIETFRRRATIVLRLPSNRPPTGARRTEPPGDTAT